MKKTGLIIGILLVVTAIIGVAVCLLLPSLTNNRISFSETKFGLIGAGGTFLTGLLITNFSVISALKAKRKAKAALYKSQLQTEGLILFDENIGGTITYLNFHRPGRYSGWRKVGLGSSLIALTKTRLLALNDANPLIDVPLTDERLRKMKFSLEGEKTLVAAFDANLFQPKWSGEIEYRFKTTQAQEFLQKINELTNRPLQSADL